MGLTEKISGSKFFTNKEALWLPQWNRAACEDDGLTEELLNNIKETAQWMDKVREYFGKPIRVHCWLRPLEYNKLVKGAKSSQHLLGKAVDFDVVGMTCDDAKAKLLADNKLEEFGIRMEDNVGGSWIHLDSREPGPAGRFFKP